MISDNNVSQRPAFIKKRAYPPEEHPNSMPVMMMTLVRLRQHGSGALQAFSCSMDGLPEVMACLQLSGEFDFLLQVALSNIEEYEPFLMKKLCVLPIVEKVKSSLVLKVCKLVTTNPVA